MADKKKYVTLKGELKDTSVKGIKADALIKKACETIANAINTKSSGKMTTKDKGPEGFILTASITTLKGDDKDAPTKLETKIAIVVMTIGSSAKAFTGVASGSLSGLGKNIQADAEDLVSSVLDSFMPKAISTMLSF